MAPVSTTTVQMTDLRMTDAMIVRRWLRTFLHGHCATWVDTLELDWGPGELEAQLIATDLVSKH